LCASVGIIKKRFDTIDARCKHEDHLVNYICQRNNLILCSCGFWHQVLLYFLPEESSSVFIWNIGIHPSECSKNWAGNMLWRFSFVSYLHYD